MDEKTTVSELRKEKKMELKAVIKRTKKLEKDRVATRHGNTEMHLGIEKDLDKLYLRRRALKDFLRELSGGERLILSSEKVMCFDD